MTTNEDKKNYSKIMLIGSGGAGKSSYKKKLISNEFETKYIPTLNMEVFTLEDGLYNIWDCAGQERYSGLKEIYWINSKAVIIMFDLTSRLSYKEATVYFRQVRNILPNTPIILCGNKTDCNDAKTLYKTRDWDNKTYYCEISVKTGYNLYKPLELVEQQLNTTPNYSKI